jgi:hypothetical protein
MTTPGTTDTTGTTGQPGPASSGTAGRGSTADTETPGAGGSTTAAPATPPGVNLDTEGAYGNTPYNIHQPDSLSPPVTGTRDSQYATQLRDANPVYRAANLLLAPAQTADTTRTDQPVSSGTGTPPVPTSVNVLGTTETYQIGAYPAPANHNTPPAPTTPTVAAGPRYVVVTWVAPTPVSGAPTLGYRIEGDTGGVAFAGAADTSVRVYNLKPNQLYKFKVAARNYNGIGVFSALSATVAPWNPDESDVNKPAGITTDNRLNPIYRPDGTVVAGTGGYATNPGTPVAAIASATSATVTWTAPTFGAPFSGYVAKASTGQQTSVSGSTLTAVVTGLTTGTPVTFTVTATNARGTVTSAASNSITPA